MSALAEIEEHAGEPIEAIVFGAWGWGSLPQPGSKFEPGYGEPDETIPLELRGKVLMRSEAETHMQRWSCYGGHGAPDCYAIRAWTANKVVWITQYDGATSLDSAPRHPVDMVPDMPGG